MSFRQNLQSIIEAISDGMAISTIKKNEQAFLILKETHDRNPEEFLDLVDMALYDFDTLIEAVINVPEQENSGIVKFIANGLYEHFHEKRIEKLEGSMGCSDKAKFIKLMTLKALKSSQNLSLFADYKNVEQIKECKERQAYWSPKSIKDTNEAISLFMNWYYLREN